MRVVSLRNAAISAATLALCVTGCSGTTPSSALPAQTNALRSAEGSQAAAPTFKAFTAGTTPGFLSSANALDVAPGRNGSIWFTDIGTPAIGTIDPSGNVREYTGLPANARPYSIVAAPNGMAWFTDSGTASVGRISPRGVVKEFSNPRLSGSYPQGITIAPDGTVWFVSVGPKAFLAHVDEHDAVHAIALPSTLSPDGSLIADNSGNLWLVAQNPHQKALVVQRESNGTLITHPTQLVAAVEPCCPNLAAKRMTIGPDGNPWLTTLNYIKGSSPANWIVTITPAGPVYFYVHTGSINYPVYPSGITTSGTKLWFTGGDPFQVNGGLWSMKTDGSMTAYPIPYDPVSLTTASDGNLWFTTHFGGQPSQIVEALIK